MAYGLSWAVLKLVIVEDVADFVEENPFSFLMILKEFYTTIFRNGDVSYATFTAGNLRSVLCIGARISIFIWLSPLSTCSSLQLRDESDGSLPIR